MVSYLDGELARFVARLRGELEMAEVHLRPHITLLPPRVLNADADRLQQWFHEAAEPLCPIDITFAAVRTFSPVSPTLYIAITTGADDLVRANARLQTALGGEPEFPYVPHLTLAQFKNPEQLLPATERARAAWAEFHSAKSDGAKSVTLGHAVLVAESSTEGWEDIVRLRLPTSAPERP